MANIKPLKVYLDLMSQPCRAVLIFLKANKIPHTVENVALRKGEQNAPEFIKLNPMQKVPVMEENGFVLTESDAILKYIATTYKVPDHWYPREAARRARVDEYTAWHHTNTRQHAASVFIYEFLLPRLMHQAVDPVKLQKALVELEATLDKLENMFLKRQAFLCGDDISLADLLAVCELMQPLCSGRDVLKDRPRLMSWRRRVQSALSHAFSDAHAVLYRVRDRHAARL